MSQNCRCPYCNPINKRNFEYVAPQKLTLKEKLHKQRMENWESSERVLEKILRGDYNQTQLTPIIIFKTDKQLNNHKADDLLSGDLSKSDIIKLSPMFKEIDRSFNSDSDHLFENLQAFVSVAAWGEYSSIVSDLFLHMKKNTGITYESQLLTKATKNHRTTKQHIKKTTSILSEILKNNNGELTKINIKETQRKLMQEKLPKFSDFDDNFNGLALAVHDVYAVQITLKEININKDNRTYTALISYKIQDHFGLDKLDVTSSEKPFHIIGFFRDWFILQRYNKFGFKPFITEMNFSANISDEF